MKLFKVDFGGPDIYLASIHKTFLYSEVLLVFHFELLRYHYFTNFGASVPAIINDGILLYEHNNVINYFISRGRSPARNMPITIASVKPAKASVNPIIGAGIIASRYVSPSGIKNTRGPSFGYKYSPYDRHIPIGIKNIV